MIRQIPTTLSGKQEKHDSELKNELEKIVKKIKILDLNLYQIEPRKSKINYAKVKSIQKQRSLSADNLKKTNSDSNLENKIPKINFNDILRKNLSKSTGSLDSSRTSPSILKKSSSPRTRKEIMRKKVQFNSQNMYNDDKKPKETEKTHKIEINLNWILSVCYDENKNIKNIKNVENFDKSIKNVSPQAIKKYDQNLLKIKKTITEKNEQDEQIELNNYSSEMEKMIYVFECKHWLAKDMEDKKIERILKPSNFLKSK